MASLSFIMDMDDEEPGSQVNKRGDASMSTGPNRGHEPSASSSHANPRDPNDRETPATTSSKRRGHSGRPTKSSAHSSSSSSTARRPPSRQLSNASASSEEMDHGYGGQASGSSSNPPMRPMGNPPGGEIPVKLTPITGRVSRAKKGVPVHTCEQCRPPKTFTRAEHLRRHQLSHQTPQFACLYPGCGRVFHRHDLLTRHASRHELNGGRVSSRGTGESSSRRSSMTSMDEAPKMNFPQQGTPNMTRGSISLGATSTPSSDMPSGATYPSGNSSYAPVSNQPNIGTPMSPPQPQDRRGSYPSSSGQSPGQRHGYVLSSTSQIPMINNQAISPIVGQAYDEFSQPRTSSPFPLYLVTEGLQQNPGLLAPHEASPWPSSDSNYSTPSDLGQTRSWVRSFGSPISDWTGSGLMAPYQPTSTSHDLRSPGSGLEAMATASPYFSNPFSPASLHPSYVNGLDLPVSFHDENSLHIEPYSSVRSPTLATNPSSVQSAETLVTLAPLVSDTVVGSYKDSAALLGPLSSATFLTAITLPRSLRNAIPEFLNVYWRRFDTFFPLVHRRSFETASTDGTEVLRCAMAAVATQFLDGREDRMKGNQLHEFAWQEARRATYRNVHIMQAILLCEFFARFRGRKAVVRPSQPFQSQPFQSLYSGVATPQTPNTNNTDIFGLPITGRSTKSTNEQRWTEWIEAESRRRLLAACFVLDVHTSMYHEQPLTQSFSSLPPIPLIKPSEDLWAASSPDAWERLLSGPIPDPSVLCEVANKLTPNLIASAPPLDRAVFLASEALRLPKRAIPSALDLSVSPDLSVADRLDYLFPDSPVANTYLALHYTPLDDLLAVIGESWIFTQKVLPPQCFRQNQKRLNKWSTSLHAAAAARFAARALIVFLGESNISDTNRALSSTITTTFSSSTSNFDNKNDESDSITWNKSDISDYWAIYICALICWALNHHATRRNNSNISGGDGDTGQHTNEAEVLGWLHIVASLNVMEDVLKLAKQKQGATAGGMGVVAMVKRRLEIEAAGGKSRLLVDALGVLKKMQEGVNWKWF